jgi:Protein of unknown function (DUF2950)
MNTAATERNSTVKSEHAKAMQVAAFAVIGLALGSLLGTSRACAAEAASTANATPTAPTAAAGGPEVFATPEQAADAIVAAAEKFDVPALLKIVGPGGEDVVLTGEYAQDRERAQEFAAQARKKKHLSVDPKTKTRAFLLVGETDWPFALPIVKRGAGWVFDVAAGREELFNRRIGNNELDAIAVCRGFVEAQFEYALRKRNEYEVAQYAQQIVSTPGKQDGLAWQNPDGTWGGPVGERIARAIHQGYDVKGEPYHGYFFKVLTGQGPAAPMGAMDFVVKGVMIGGFALLAAPAEYGQTGVMTFMVSHTGVVYEKDLGPATLDTFAKTERFNPDKSWSVVED